MFRCKHCNCKSSVILDCKCNNKYCTKHLLPEIHKCSELIKFRQEAHDQNEKLIIKANQKEKLEWLVG